MRSPADLANGLPEDVARDQQRRTGSTECASRRAGTASPQDHGDEPIAIARLLEEGGAMFIALASRAGKVRSAVAEVHHQRQPGDQSDGSQPDDGLRRSRSAGIAS